MGNTGYKFYSNRRRLINGIPDGYEEPNTISGGIGPYISPVIDYDSCPTTSTTTTSTSTTTLTTSSSTSSTTSSSSTTTTSSTTSTTTTIAPTYIWIEDTSTCEQETPFMLDVTVATLSSPQGLYYDSTLDRFYVVDLDDVNGNLWYFNPDTFSTSAGRNYISGSAVPGQYVQSHDHSESLRKIFFAGPSTSGVYVYDIDLNNLNLINTGSNGSFSRVFTKFLNGDVYSSNAVDDTLTIIDPTTETVSSVINVSTIPGNTGNKYFNTSYNMLSVNGELWVCAAAYRALSGNIARYDATLTSFLGEIVIPFAATPTTGGGWAGGFWQSQFFDAAENRFYLTDVGSKRITIIDTSVPGSPSIVEQVHITNLQGKNYAFVSWDLNSTTGDFYATKTAVNNPSDGSPIYKFYKTNRTTYQYEAMYVDATANGLKVRSGTNELWSANAGVPGWAGVAGWNTDGQVFKYIQ